VNRRRRDGNRAARAAAEYLFRHRRRGVGLGTGQQLRRAQEFADAVRSHRTRGNAAAVRAVTTRELREPVDDEKRGTRVVVVALGEEARAFGHYARDALGARVRDAHRRRRLGGGRNRASRFFRCAF
jgi:hypothetical protein